MVHALAVVPLLITLGAAAAAPAAQEPPPPQVPTEPSPPPPVPSPAPEPAGMPAAEVPAPTEVPAPAEAPPADLWVLSGPSAMVLGGPSAETRARVEIGENGQQVLVSPDGAFVAVGSLGATTGGEPGKDDPLLPKAGSGSSVTIVRRPTHEVVGRASVAFRPGLMAFTPDGAGLLVVSRGQTHKDLKTPVPAGLVLLDTATAAKKVELPLATPPADVWYVASANRVVLALGGARPPSAPELLVVDLATGLTEKTPLSAAPNLFHPTGVEDLRYLDLADGVVVVDSAGKLRGEPIRAGTRPVFATAPSGERCFLAGQAGKKGQLKVLEQGAVAKTLDVPKVEAIVFDPKGERAVVASAKEGALIDLRQLAVEKPLKMAGSVTELEFTPSGRELYSQLQMGTVGVVDLEQGKKVAAIRTGRAGKMFGKLLARALPMALASALLIPAIPLGTAGGYAWSYQPILMPGAPRVVQSMAFSSDGQRAFVFNSFTKDITVVDTRTRKGGLKVGTGDVPKGAPFLWLNPSGDRLVSCGVRKLVVLATDTGTVKMEQEFPDGSSLRCEGGFAFVTTASGTAAYRIDPYEKVKELDRVMGVAIEPSSKRLVLSTAKGAELYDDQLNLIRKLEDTIRVDAVRLVPGHVPAAPGAPSTDG